MFKTSEEITKLTVDILKGTNTRIWGGVKEAEKVGTIVKGDLCLGDSFIGVTHAAEDISCGDYVCATLDVVGSLSSSLSIVLGNIPKTKSLTKVTGVLTIGCRTARY
jgi:hypothetical protein